MKTENLSNPHVEGALCTAHNRSGKPCQKRPVNGWKVCRMHGAGGGRPITNPKTLMQKSLESGELRLKADALIESGADVLDLRQVAAQLHVLADELADKRHDGKSLPLLLQTLESARKTAESVERIRASKAFTTAERDWFVLALSDFVETVPEAEKPRLQEFIRARIMGLHTGHSLPIALETA